MASSSVSCVLVVLGVYLEVTLGVSAYGANFRSLGANNDVAAVTAFPNLNFALLENLSGFDVLQKGTITLFMMLLDFATMRNLAARALKPSSSAVLAKSSYISVHS